MPAHSWHLPKRNQNVRDFNQVIFNIITFKAMYNLREFDLSRPLWVVLSLITLYMKDLTSHTQHCGKVMFSQPSVCSQGTVYMRSGGDHW